MRPTLFFFLAAVKGFRAMEKRRGKRDGREGVGVDRDAEVRDAECFRLDFLFVSSSRRRPRGWEMEPIFARIFFSSFSLLFWVDVEAVKNEMTDILVTLSLSQSSAAACAPTNTRSSVNTTS